MKPWKRICMNLLLPPGVAATILIVMSMIHSLDNDMPPAGTVFAFAYAYGIIPSALFTATMEGLYRKKGLSPRSARAVIGSTLWWAVAGFVFDCIMTFPTKLATVFTTDTLIRLALYLGLGFATGLIIGVIVTLVEQHAQKKAGMA
jgi:hypothetical protein